MYPLASHSDPRSRPSLLFSPREKGFKGITLGGKLFCLSGLVNIGIVVVSGKGLNRQHIFQ